MSCFMCYLLRFTSFLFVLAGLHFTTFADSNVLVRIMAANTTSGTQQSYESPGIRIFQGLKPDIVAIQEFQYGGSTASNDLRTLVNTAFGTQFSFYCEPNNGIPNGIVSRYPILASGSWDDSTTISDRGFAWARIDLPGTNELYVVSVHLKASNTADDQTKRAAEAAELKDLITTNFPANAWVVLAGDMNLYDESETCIITLKTFLSDSPVPADQNGDTDTNLGRGERYDRVLLSFSMTNKLVPLVMPSRTYTNGLVFDSRVYTNLTDVPPVVMGDSGVSGMQHMAVVKDIQYTVYEGGASVAPVITNQPQSLTVTQGSNASFSVLAGGTAQLSYQWRFASTNIGSATNATYTRTNAQSAHAGSYVVVITNSAGSVTSSVATLTVLAAPSFAAQPQSLTVTQGNNAGFSVTAAGQPAPSYQWRFAGTNISGATSSTYTRIAAQPVDAGNYTCVLSNSVGSLTSSVASLTILFPPFISAQPVSLTVTQGGQANFSVTATGNPAPSYQWQLAATNLPGETASTLGRNNVTMADVGNYSVLVSNSVGTEFSANASLTVLVPPTINTQPQDQTVAQAATASFTVGAAGSAPLGYQWLFNSSNLAGETATGYSRINVQPADVGGYSVVITNAVGSLTSAVANLTLQIPEPLITIVLPGLLHWDGLSNLTYTVQSRTNATGTNWDGIGTASSPSNTIWFTNPADADELRIFRVTYP